MSKVILRSGTVEVKAFVLLMLMGLVLCLSNVVFAEESVSTATQQYNQGMNYLKAGQDAQAKQVFKNLAVDISGKKIEFSDQDGIADVVYLLAKSYRKAKDDRAIKLYQYILSKYPSHNLAVRAQGGLARCYIQKNEDSKAKAAIEKLLTDYSAHPEFVEVIGDLAKSYRKQKDDRAIELYQHILSKHPSHNQAAWAQSNLVKCYIQKNEDSKAQAAIEKLLTDYSAHPDIVEIILNLANSNGSIIELYQHIVSNYPSHDLAVRAQFRIARRYLGRDEYIKAQAAIEKLLTDYSAHPDIVKVIGEIAYIYRKKNEYDRLIALYQYILSKYPSHNLAIQAQYGMARYYIEKKEDSNAEAAVEKLLSNYSSHPEIVKVIGDLAGKCRKVRTDISIELYQHILSNYPSHNRAILAQADLAKCYMLQKENTKADAAVKKLLSDYSDHSYIAKGVGVVADSYRKQKDDRAIELYQHILSKYPLHNWVVRAQSGLARCYIQKNEDVKAVAAIKKLLANYSDHPDIAECIGAVAGSYPSKKYDRAVELYQFILSKYPSHNWVKQARSDNDIIKVFAELADSYSGKKTDRPIELYQYILSDHFSNHWRVRKWRMHAQYRLARIYIDRKDYPKAEAAVEKLLANYSDRSKIAEYIGRIAESYPRKEYDRATKLYQFILSKYPSHKQAIWAQADIALCYIRDNEMGKAQAVIEKVLTDYSDHPDIVKVIDNLLETYRTKNPDRAIELYQFILSKSSSHKAIRAQAGLAICYIHQEEDSKAEAAIEKLLADYSDHPNITGCIGSVAADYRTKKPDRAIELYQHIISKYPSHDWAMVATKEIVVTAIEAGDEQMAREYCKNIIDNYMAYPGVARQFMFIGEKYYHKALSDDPSSANDPDFYFTRTAEICKCILEKMPPLPEKRWQAEVHQMLARSYRNQGKHSLAITHYTTALEVWPDCEYNWKVQFMIGRSYENMLKTSQISESEAKPLTMAAYRTLLEKYPDCFFAKHANDWINKNSAN